MSLRSPIDVMRDFQAQGQSVTAWAREHGFAPHCIYAVLEGRSKCFRGEAHRAAVALGIKAAPMEGRLAHTCEPTSYSVQTSPGLAGRTDLLTETEDPAMT